LAIAESISTRETPVKAVAPRVTREEAWNKLHRRTFVERLIGMLTSRPHSPGGMTGSASHEVEVANRKLPLLETAWLPTYRANISARTDSHAAKFDVLINAHTGFAVMADLDGVEWTELALELPTDLPINAARAGELARAAVNRAVLSRPGWGRSCEIEFRDDSELIGYPAWAYYFATRTGMLDAKLLDAMSGATGGPQLKTSLLATLAALQRNRRTEV